MTGGSKNSLSLMGEGQGEGVASNTKRARKLRVNMTTAERQLWKLVRSEAFASWKFRRQHPIGLYIADFACPEILLIIEVDGGQHCENTKDAERTIRLESSSWRVIRFWNNDVLKNPEGVSTILLQYLETASSHRGKKKVSLPKSSYSYNTLTRPAPPADLSHEGEVEMETSRQRPLSLMGEGQGEGVAPHSHHAEYSP